MLRTYVSCIEHTFQPTTLPPYRDYTRPDLSNGPGMEGAEMHGGMHGLSPGPPVHNRVPDLATALAGTPPSTHYHAGIQL